MKYTFKLLTNPEMTAAEQDFVTGLLQAFELNSTTWTRIESGEEIPEILICTVDAVDPTTPQMMRYSMFSISWNDMHVEPAVNKFRNYTAGQFGKSWFSCDTKTYYFEHEVAIVGDCYEVPHSKGFFPSLHRMYSTDTPNQFGYAVGCALNDLMLVESIYEEREEHA